LRVVIATEITGLLVRAAFTLSGNTNQGAQVHQSARDHLSNRWLPLSSGLSRQAAFA
jgi:hypothetical protein